MRVRREFEGIYFNECKVVVQQRGRNDNPVESRALQIISYRAE